METDGAATGTPAAAAPSAAPTPSLKPEEEPYVERFRRLEATVH